VTEIPPYSFDPIRQAAVFALNSRSGSPIVEIRCAAPYRHGSCARPLGGAYATPHGIVVLLNRLQRRSHDTVSHYQEISRQPKDRNRAWRQGGFIEEEPVLLKPRDGTWRVVPGEDKEPTVRCPRHGAWPIDLEAVTRKVEEAQVARAKQRYGTAPRRTADGTAHER